MHSYTNHLFLEMQHIFKTKWGSSNWGSIGKVTEKMSNLRWIANLILFKTSRHLLQNDQTSGDPQCFGQFLPKIYN